MQPDNFILCIDNSKSIKGQERVLIRETAMLLADLADNGDRISVVTFGEGAQLAASALINSNRDRIDFKSKVQKRVNFSENFSDIRAGIRLLAEDPGSPLENKGFTPNVIILSDGKLEPRSRKTLQAFREIKEMLKNQLAGIDFYAMVLGNRYCNDVILSNINGSDLDGKTLMREYIATSADHFFHAKSLDQLIDGVVAILSKSKGISSLGDTTGSHRFRIDSSVSSMMLIVRKRSTDGSILCSSSDIILTPPEKTTVKDHESIYRNSDYQFLILSLCGTREKAYGLSHYPTVGNRKFSVKS